MYLFWLSVCVVAGVSPPYFLVATSLFISMYPGLHLIFFNDLLYRRLPFDSQMQVIANKMTAVVMLCLLPCVTYGWDQTIIERCGTLYTAVHVAALVMTTSGWILRTKRLMMMIFMSAVPYIDFHETPACCVVVYFCFECLLFWVTYMTAEGFLYRVYTFDIHIAICTCSWLWQLYYMAVNDMSFWGVVWVSGLVILVNNDVIALQR